MSINKLNNNHIDILLSIYNGSEYVIELINSILNQTYQNWKLYIRDDGSSDGTVSIIKSFEDKHPEKIVFIDDGMEHLGPCLSFSKLMDYSDAPYIMFCDQDDIWLESKIQLTLSQMLTLERNFPASPLLVHTDLIVVNRNQMTLDDSFWSYQNLDPSKNHLNHLLIQNVVTGCTLMINKHLKLLATPIPEEAIMHDWWLALVASMFSGIYNIDDPTLLYRQHNDNTIGAKRYSIKNNIKKIFQMKQSIQKAITQGETFYSLYKKQMNADQVEMLENFISLNSVSRIKRLKVILKYRFKKNGIVRNIGFILSLFIIKL